MSKILKENLSQKEEIMEKRILRNCYNPYISKIEITNNLTPKEQIELIKIVLSAFHTYFIGWWWVEIEHFLWKIK